MNIIVANIYILNNNPIENFVKRKLKDKPKATKKEDLKFSVFE